MESKYLTRLLTLKAGSKHFALSLRWSNQGEQSEHVHTFFGFQGEVKIGICT